MNPPLKLFKKCIILLLFCGSHFVFAESILGVSKSTVCPGESIDFWDDFSELTQSDDIYDFTIDFRDGTKESSNQKHCYFQHVFQKEGNYNVQLKAFNGIKTIVAETIILVRKDIVPESFLDVSKNTLKSICPGTEVYFQTDWNQNYTFDYGDGYKGTSGVHTYQSSGIYQPVLIVRNVCGNELKIAGELITVSDQNTFSENVDAYIWDLPSHSKGFSVNTAVQFKSMPADAYLWNFGDGTTSITQNPTHIYTSSGKYNIRLTLEDGCFNDTTIQLVVNVIPDYTEELLIDNTRKIALEVYPNPNKGEINVRMNVGESNYARIELYDPTGNLAKQINLGPLSGEKSEKILLTSPQAGLYNLYLITESETYYQKLVIEKQ
jgi:PKD repeat protein